MTPNEFMKKFRKEKKPMAAADQAKVDKVAEQLRKLQMRLSQMAAKITSGSLKEEELAECEQAITDLQATTDKVESVGIQASGI